MLQIKSLQKKYGNRYAVNDLSFSFASGIYGVLGPNGAGKTTMLGMIMGLFNRITDKSSTMRPRLRKTGLRSFQRSGIYRRIRSFIKTFLLMNS